MPAGCMTTTAVSGSDATLLIYRAVSDAQTLQVTRSTQYSAFLPIVKKKRRKKIGVVKTSRVVDDREAARNWPTQPFACMLVRMECPMNCSGASGAPEISEHCGGGVSFPLSLFFASTVPSGFSISLLLPPPPSTSRLYLHFFLFSGRRLALGAAVGRLEYVRMFTVLQRIYAEVKGKKDNKLPYPNAQRV